MGPVTTDDALIQLGTGQNEAQRSDVTCSTSQGYEQQVLDLKPCGLNTEALA
jgi:hypothetical protein